MTGALSRAPSLTYRRPIADSTDAVTDALVAQQVGAAPVDVGGHMAPPRRRRVRADSDLSSGTDDARIRASPWIASSGRISRLTQKLQM